MLKYNVIPRKNPLDKSVKYYGQLVPVTPVGLREIAEQISQQSTVTEHDVKAVLSALEQQLIFYLRNGNSVRLGDLGSFRPVLKSKGVDAPEDFTPANITKVKVRFKTSSKFRYAMSAENPQVQFANAQQ